MPANARAYPLICDIAKMSTQIMDLCKDFCQVLESLVDVYETP